MSCDVLDAIIILAAGRSRRMLRDTPKALQPLAGTALIRHVVDAVLPLADTSGHNVLCVLPPNKKGRDIHALIPETTAVVQPHALGTADAVKTALSAVKNTSGACLIICGDTPLITPPTLAQLITARQQHNAAIAVAAIHKDPPCDFGRIILNSNGTIERIIEAHNATPEQYALTLNNVGVFAIETKVLTELIPLVSKNPVSDEYDLTQIIALAKQKQLVSVPITIPEDESHGINTLSALVQAERIMQRRLQQKALARGVWLQNPDTVTLAYDSQWGRNITVAPYVVFGNNVIIEDYVQIHSFSSISHAHIKQHAVIGPHARIRAKTTIAEKSRIGNFVEIKNTQIDKEVRINHLSYIGDSHVGRNVNIGAGVITCNYDGRTKHQTLIEENAFIGSNASLVAPLKIGKNAVVAAGSVLTENVDANKLALARSRQITKEKKKSHNTLK